MTPARNFNSVTIVAIILSSLAVAGLALTFPAEVFAQGCAMCKLSAEAAGERTARALDYGIFILMTPAVMAFLGLFYWAFNHRDETLADQMEAEDTVDSISQPNAS